MWAYVRKRGAIGQFYSMFFEGVSSKAEWFDKYSDEWELYHFCVGDKP
jgi:hypothetical protein